MGLAEKRGAKEFEESVLPGLKKKINDAAGFDVALDINWDTLAEEGMAHLYNEAFEKVYFSPTIEALQAIGKDDMGKEALKSSLKKIEFCNVGGFADKKGISFKDGVLKVDHKPTTNLGDGPDRKNAILERVEAGL